ncbi:MAG: toxin-antitoxin system YwqK family antitoxin [Bacteroidales bacterium]
MKLIPILVFIYLVICTACQPKQEQTDQIKSNIDSIYILKSYYEKSGKLKSEITVKNKRKNGPAKEYYPSGKLRSLVHYVENITIGETIWYYENGQPYRITPYINGKMNGIRKIYYDNGKLQAEIPYKNGVLLEGSKEFDKSGQLIKNYPKIVFETSNTIKTHNIFTLFCKLDKKANHPIFYHEVKNSQNESVLNILPVKNGVSYIDFYIPAHTKVNKSIPIWVEFKTQLGNPYLTKKVYELNNHSD